MKNPIILLMPFLVLFYSASTIQQDNSTSYNWPQDNDRIEELDNYWATLAKTAKNGDFYGMKSLYHKDAVVVKIDTTFSVSEAFELRWKKEIMEVKNGKRANTLEFRFSKRIGNEVSAFEKGIYPYTSINTSNNSVLGDSYIHFETLLVKNKDKWVALMEYQKTKAAKEEWQLLQ